MEPQTPKKPKHRSPSYPAIDLQTALKRTEQLWKVAERHPLPLAEAMKAWGYSTKSSGGLLAAAALKKYGLVRDEKVAGGRHLKVSDLGRAIVIDEDTPERASRIQQAALTPSIHTEIWEKYDSIPPEGTLRFYLVNERGFSTAAADELIKEVRKTFEFAGLTAASGSLSPDDGESESDYAEVSTPTSRTSIGAVESHGPGGTQYTGERRGVIRPSAPQAPVGVPLMEIPIPVRQGVIARLIVPAEMTDAEWKVLFALVEAYRQVSANTVRLEDQGLGPVSDEISVEATSEQVVDEAP